jgi:hypothetical protein
VAVADGVDVWAMADPTISTRVATIDMPDIVALDVTAFLLLATFSH